MKKSWESIVDIIPVNIQESGVDIRIHNYAGFIYELSSAWILMLSLAPDASISEDKWVAVSSLLLSSHSESGCGLSSYQGKWWLSCRYAESNIDVTQQLSLASFIEKWPVLVQHQQISPALSLNVVPNKWV